MKRSGFLPNAALGQGTDVLSPKSVKTGKSVKTEKIYAAETAKSLKISLKVKDTGVNPVFFISCRVLDFDLKNIKIM